VVVPYHTHTHTHTHTERERERERERDKKPSRYVSLITMVTDCNYVIPTTTQHKNKFLGDKNLITTLTKKSSTLIKEITIFHTETNTDEEKGKYFSKHFGWSSISWLDFNY